MSLFFEAVRHWFSADGFVPRQACGLWPDWLVWEHVGGNALIWLTYLALPVMIWRIGVRRADWAPFQGVVVSFTLFIGLSGLGYFLDMLAFFYPMYRISGLVLAATGLASVWTAWSVRQVWPKVMAVKSLADLERAITNRTGELFDATEALRESERRFRAIFDSTFQFIGLIAPDGTVLEINKTALDFVRATREEVIGRPVWETPWWGYSAEARDLLRKAVADAGEGRPVRYEEVIQGADGATMTVDFSLNPILDDSGRAVFLIPECHDITERKQAELGLASLASIVESSDDAIMGKDLGGVVTSWNRGAERLFGYTAAEAIGRPMTFLFPPDRLGEESAILARLRSGESVHHFESVRLAKDGRAVDVSLTISPIKDRSGRIVGISKIARDITERVRAAAKARLMNEELERLFGQRTEELRQRVRLIDQAHDAIMVRSGSGVISSWNQGAERLYKWTKEEAVGRVSHELLKTQFPTPLSEIEGELASLGSWAGELVHERRDGVHVVTASRWVLDRDGSAEEAVLEINSDVTERKLAIQQLKDSNDLTRAIFDAAANAIMTIGDEGLFESLNPAAERLFGYPAAELVGQSIQVLMPEPYRSHPNYVATYLATGVKKIIGIGRDVEARRKDGSTFPMHLEVNEFWLGSRRMFAGFARDLSEREKAEAELRRARDGAMAGSRAKSEFVANMSHEIRTPMNGVLGMTNLLLDTPLNDLQRGYAETIQGSGEALLTVINDILDFSKIEARKLTLELTEFNLRTLMEELADLLAPSAFRKGLKLSCRVAREVPGRLVGDPARIRQVLTNLAGNAVKFTDRGEVALEARLLESDGDRVKLRILVRDTGIGIPEDRQADVFESFTQIEGGSSRRHGGTGLGLTICQSLVALMGGRIGLESRIGEGSTFWFEVTLGKGDCEADPMLANLDGLRVLIVDDQEAEREAPREMLLSWECRPELAGSGAEALARLLANPNDDPFSLILIAKEMPGMNGEQTARIIRSSFRYAKVPMVLLTSAGSPELRGAVDDLWAATMAKPVRRSLLFNTLCRTVAAPEPHHVPPSADGAEALKLPSTVRILLAEDNEVNRQVAIGMAERLGCEVDAVWNGQEALEALDYDRHALILMDVQMPEMDGLTATAAIRGREQGTGRHIPIIAITAHAMQGDRERCIAAGMDGYLSKPIRPEPLREALRIWAARIEPPPDPAEAPIPPESPTPFAQGLRESCGDDPKLTRKVLELMLQGVPVRLERLQAAINAGEASQAAREAHSLKGAFATVGSEDLALACQNLMACCQQPDLALIREAHQPIQDRWETLAIEAARYLETLTVPI